MKKETFEKLEKLYMKLNQLREDIGKLTMELVAIVVELQNEVEIEGK